MQAFATIPGLCSASDRIWSLVFARQVHCQKSYFPRTAVLPTLGLVGCVPLTAHPSQGLQVALSSPMSFPSSPAGCVGAAWLACLWLRPRCRLVHGPIHPPTPSWADRKIPDIVVQRWLQAGRQQEVGAGEGGREPPEHLEASGPDRPCSWRATCLHEYLCVSRLSRLSGLLVTHPPGLGQ